MKTQTKNIKTFLWVLPLMITFTFFSCEKDPLEECRKDPTCEYFTCKVNGERWNAQCDGGSLFGCSPWDVLYDHKITGHLSMYIDNFNGKILLFTRNFKLNLGNNKLFTSNSTQTSPQNCVKYSLETIFSNTIFITKIDTVNRFLSGTFHFTAKNDCEDDVTITDGEFNLPYRF